MAMSKMNVYKSKYVRKSRKKPTNSKLATIGTVKRLINYNVDKVRFDSQLYSSQNITTTAQIDELSIVTNESAIIDSLRYSFKIKNPTLNCVVRMLIFQWKDTSVPVVGDLLVYTTDPLSPIGNGSSPSGDIRYNCGGKLHVLHDFLFTFDIVSNPIRARQGTFYKNKLLDLSDDGSETKNKVYIMTLSDTAVTPPVLAFDYSSVYHLQ